MIVANQFNYSYDCSCKRSNKLVMKLLKYYIKQQPLPDELRQSGGKGLIGKLQFKCCFYKQIIAKLLSVPNHGNYYKVPTRSMLQINGNSTA